MAASDVSSTRLYLGNLTRDSKLPCFAVALWSGRDDQIYHRALGLWNWPSEGTLAEFTGPT